MTFTSLKYLFALLLSASLTAGISSANAQSGRIMPIEGQLFRIAMEQLSINVKEEKTKKRKTANKHHKNNHDEPRPYDKTRDAMADANSALAMAMISGKKPLLVLGANWCHDSRGLAARFEKPEFQSLIQDNYELRYIDVGKRDRNLDVAKRFGIHQIIGTPTVLVLSPEGKLLNRDSAHMWKRAASIAEDETYDYFKTFAEGRKWQEATE